PASTYSRKIFLQHWHLRLDVAALRCGIGARLEHVTIASAHDQLGAVDAHFDVASLSRMRSVLWIVAKAVLTTQFFSYRTKRGIKILLLGIVKPGAADAGKVVKILIAAFVFASSASC